MKESRARNSSFELLRLILMLLIVIGHGILLGLGLGGLSPTWGIPMHVRPDDMLLCTLTYCMCVSAVNIFILMSGYFGIKISKEKVCKLLFSMLFYSLIFGTLYYVIVEENVKAIRSLLVLSNSPYWFVIDYLFLLCFIPMIHLFIEKSTKREFQMFIIALLTISSYFGFVWHHPANLNGYTLMQFITLYCVGRYIKIYDVQLSKVLSSLLFILCSLLAGALMYLLYQHGNYGWSYQMCYYNNPLIVIAGISAILLFKNIHFSSKFINHIAASSVSIYFVQSSPLFCHLYYSCVENKYLHDASSALKGGGIILIIIILAVLITITAIIIDQVQIKINKKIVNRFFY